jgi:hypothetical protein
MEVRMRHAAIVLMCLAVAAGAASAQSTPSVLEPPGYTKTINLSGPRFGLTALSPGVVDELHKRSVDVTSNISQFGWQFEREFYSRDSGVAAVNEWVVLLGGLDQGVAIPSLSWLVGLRTREGAEFGIGPNVTPAGVALALAGGVTFRAGNLNVPMNVAVVPSKVGARISVLTGFNMRRR